MLIQEAKCRVCESVENLKPLFGEELNTIPLKLMSCANVQVFKEDGLPQNICSNCISLLELCYTFKLQCEKVDSKLRIIADSVNIEKICTGAVQCPSITLNLIANVEHSIEKDNIQKIETDCKTENIEFDAVKNPKLIETSIITTIDITSEITSEIAAVEKKSKPARTQLKKTSKSYPCTACSEVFDNYVKWTQHRDTHGAKRYLCRICNKFFGKKAYLDKHKKIHEDINSIKIHECKVCFKKYTSNGNLKRHMRGHDGDLRHICDLCGKRFIQSTTLRSHQLTHQDTKEFACTYCDKAFKSKQYLTQHREKMHSELSGINLFSCDICGRRFINERNLKWHIRNHIENTESKGDIKIIKKTKPRDYCCICTYCGKTFKQKAQLHIHQRIHTGEKPYECEICYKKFRFQASYKFHLNSHTGERPFPCTLCDRRFKQPTHLRNHQRMHTGVKPHKCAFCDKCFASKSNMKVHTRIHTGERPYVCNECGLGFLDSNGLKKHSRKHVT